MADLDKLEEMERRVEAALSMVNELEQSNAIMEHRLEMQNDVFRLNAATAVFAAMVAHKPLTKEIPESFAIRAMEAADLLVTSYQEMLDEKERKYQQIIEAKRLERAAAATSGEGNEPSAH